MEILEQELEIPPRPEVHENAKVNGDNSGQSNKEAHKGGQLRLNRCRNAVAIIDRIPMEPISQRRRNGLFEKLMKLDQVVISRKTDISLKKLDKQEFLVAIRHAIIRFAKSVARTVVEVMPFICNLIRRTIQS